MPVENTSRAQDHSTGRRIYSTARPSTRAIPLFVAALSDGLARIRCPDGQLRDDAVGQRCRGVVFILMIWRSLHAGSACRLIAMPHFHYTATRARHGAQRGEVTMSNVVLRRIAPPAMSTASGQIHPAVIEACLTNFSDERTAEIPWEPPTVDEWRRAAVAIAKQVALHIAGYRDHDEFARDGSRFAWDVFDTIHFSSARRDH
jgi:hypothetical protein